MCTRGTLRRDDERHVRVGLASATEPYRASVAIRSPSDVARARREALALASSLHFAAVDAAVARHLVAELAQHMILTDRRGDIIFRAVAHAHRRTLHVVTGDRLEGFAMTSAGARRARVTRRCRIFLPGVSRDANLAESEACRIARLLHDAAGQLLFALQLTIADLAETASSAERPKVEDAQRLVAELDEQIRCLSRELHPLVLEDLGFVPALRQLVERIARQTHLPIVVDAADIPRQPRPVELALYRAVQEALRNAVRHARAAIRVAVDLRSNAIVCTVRDAGIGLSLRPDRGERVGVGLIAMRERLEAVGGELRLHSQRGAGTTVTMCIPIRRAFK